MKIEALGRVEAPTVLQLPDINDKERGFQKLVDIRDHFFRDVDIENIGKESLDKIYLFWNGIDNTKETMSRFRSVIFLPNMPPLEQKQVREEFTTSQQRVNKIVRSIVLLSLIQKPSRLDWYDAEKIEKEIKIFNRWQAYDNQIIAFCEAVGEAGNDLSAAGIRLRIAQHSWDELTTLFGYAKATRVSTIDHIDSEKRELTDALRGHLWSEDELVERADEYKGYLKQLKGYHAELREKLRFLWKCAQGKIPRGKSALDILHIQESVLRDLYKEGAFDPEED